MILTVDGPAAAGKGTLAARLAEHYGLAHLETGALYRATALEAVLSGGDPADPAVATEAAKRVTPEHLRDRRLREDQVTQLSSVVAAFPCVRAALLAFQRDFASRPPESRRGAILDGRDIGTVVCPDADAKIFVTASAESRARRRFKELREKGVEAIYERVLQDMKDRDARDSGRQAAPLRPASDAFVLDTTALDADQAFAAAVAYIDGKLAGKSL